MVNTPPALPEFIAAARAAVRAGNPLGARDLLDNAVSFEHAPREAQYLYLLALANAGSTALALQRYEAMSLSATERTEDWLALHGRLLKDLAFASEHRDITLLRRSAAAYEEAYMASGGYFSAINAASMWRLAGDAERSARLAQTVLHIIRSRVAETEREQYYLLVTEAEALLLLGEESAARNCLQCADGLIPGELGARASTMQQLRRLCRDIKADATLLGELRLPDVYFVQRGSEPAAGNTVAIPVGAVVHCALVDESDLRVLETLLDAGAQVHVALSDDVAVLERRWAALGAPASAQRMHSVLQRCRSRAVSRGLPSEEQAWRRYQADELALGLSLLDAYRLSDSWQLVRAGVDAEGRVAMVAGTNVANARESSQAILDAAGFQLEPPRAATPGRRLVGLIFADFAGFRRLDDNEMQRFWSEVIAGVGERLASYRSKLLLGKTWGDALHLVTADAASAAMIAVDIQQFIEARRQLPSALADLELRVAVHYAPALSTSDPISRGEAFIGSQLTFTARIEPVTPPGMVYVTEAFAARLALEAPRRFAIEYAGEIELAKGHGRFRLYSLRRRRL